MSLTVARTGWPCAPKTSHSVAGQATACGATLVIATHDQRIKARVSNQFVLESTQGAAA